MMTSPGSGIQAQLTEYERFVHEYVNSATGESELIQMSALHYEFEYSKDHNI